MVYTIKFEKEKCIGCGACTQCDNWEIGKDKMAHPLRTEFNEIGCNQDSVDICPVSAIKIIKNGD